MRMFYSPFLLAKDHFSDPIHFFCTCKTVMCGAFIYLFVCLLSTALSHAPLCNRPMPGWVTNINDILCTVLLSWFLLFYCSVLQSIFFSEVTTVTAQLNKTNRGPPRFLQANVEELYMGTRFSAKTVYLTKQVVQGSARLVCAYRVLCLPCGHTSADLQGVCSKCLILCMQHTLTHTHTHTTYIYM